MKKQLFSLAAALTFGSAVAQIPSTSWPIIQNAGFSVTAAGTRYLDVVNPNVVWLAGYDGFNAARNYNWFSRTTNGGSNFNSGNIFADTNTYVLANMEGIDANTAWVSAFTKSVQSQGVIYRTINGGANWVNMTAPGMFTNTASFANFVTFPTASNGFVCGDPIPTPTGPEYELWTTTNGGVNWTPVPAANIPNPIASEFAITDLYEKQGATNIWFGTNKGRIYYSTDAGYNWSVTPVGPVSYTVTEIAFNSPTNGLAFVAVSTTSVALFRTTDGGVSWSFVNTTDPDLGHNDLCGIPGTNFFASVDNQQQVISYSNDNGQTWNSWGGSGIPYLKVDFSDANTAWAGSFSDGTNPAVGGLFKYSGLISAFTIPTIVCKTGPTATIQPVNTSTGAVTYSWNAAASVNISSSTASSPILTFTNTGVYTITLTATNSLGVSVKYVSAVSILACTTPTASFSVSSNTLCNNVQFVLQNTSSGVPTPTFAITTSAASGVTLTNATGPTTVGVKFLTPGTYTITSTATNLFGTGVTNSVITIQDCKPIASFKFDTTLVCADGTPSTSAVTASNTTSGSGVAYTWTVTPNTATMAAAPNNGRKFTFSPLNGIGTFTVMLTATNVSGSTTAVGTFEVISCVVGINEHSSFLNNLSIYPNPAHEQLNVVLPATNDVYKIKMINVVGALVYEEKTVKGKETLIINLTNKPKGVYFLSVESGTDKAVKKIIVD